MSSRRSFNDPVHGTIDVDEAMAAMIDTAAFQRLRKVNQLSLMNYVFPGAEHSRFLHSLGVYHNAQVMCDALEISKDKRDLVLTAALLHDIGHYPFSHLGEKAYLIKEHLEKRSVIKQGRPADGLLLRYSVSRDGALHEDLGAEIIQRNSELRAAIERQVDPAAVAKLIRGDHEDAILTQILHSHLDADRLDYLVRDSTFSGVRYGMVDRDYLIRRLRKGGTDPKAFPFEGMLALGVDRRHGLHAMEHFVLARYFHYVQVVYHKTVAAFEVVMRALIGGLIELGVLPKTHKDVEAKVDDDDFLLHKFHDSFILDVLASNRPKLIEKNPNYGPLLDCILRRRRPRTVYEVAELRHVKDDPGGGTAIAFHLLSKEPQKLADLLSVDQDLIGYADATVKLEPGMSDNITNMLWVIDPVSEKATAAADEGHSLLHVLKDYEYRVFRIFYVEPTDLKDAQQHFQRARKNLLNYLNYSM